jgi:holo-[acyl-carrier protein] synthase
MIIGTGIDLVDVTRFYAMQTERKEKLAKRILTDLEYEDYQQSTDSSKYLAKIWAVKEAVAKSFGTGIQGNVTWKNMQVSKTKLGQPVLKLHENLFAPMTPNAQCHISVSHDGDMVIAIAVLNTIG